MRENFRGALRIAGAARLELNALAEHSEHFWPRFRDIPGDEFERVPHTFSMLARVRTA